jgi:uncharacterized protein YqeY
MTDTPDDLPSPDEFRRKMAHVDLGPGLRQMGQVMKAATAIAAGKADGARLSAAVKDRL